MNDCVDITLKDGQLNYSLKRDGVEIFSGTRLEYEIFCKKQRIEGVKEKLTKTNPHSVFVQSNEDPKIYLEKELWWFDVQTKFDCLSRFSGWIYEKTESVRDWGFEGKELAVEKLFPNSRLGDAVMIEPDFSTIHLMRPTGYENTKYTPKDVWNSTL